MSISPQALQIFLKKQLTDAEIQVYPLSDNNHLAIDIQSPSFSGKDSP